jgi:thiol-disulfide isomerase/thioredoxin
MRKNIYTGPILMATACAVVGVLAALGKFNSILNFPVIFAFVCLFFGGLSLWREQPRRAIAARGVILLAGVAVAVGGWVYQGRQIDERLADGRLRVLDAIQGSAVPRLTGLEPLNTDRATWDAAASFTARATVITFWARWCSPCWKEMAELEGLYQRHKDKGLRVLAVTRYEKPEDADERRSDFAKGQQFLERREISYPAAITDRDDIYRAYHVRSPPGLALVDDQGRIVDFAISLESARSLMQRAAALVAEAPTG